MDAMDAMEQFEVSFPSPTDPRAGRVVIKNCEHPLKNHIIYMPRSAKTSSFSMDIYHMPVARPSHTQQLVLRPSRYAKAVGPDS